jgi:hypothetical protein
MSPFMLASEKSTLLGASGVSRKAPKEAIFEASSRPEEATVDPEAADARGTSEDRS